MLGVVPTSTWQADTVQLPAEGILAVFTDGLIEARSAETGRLDMEGLAHLVAEAITLNGTDGLGNIADHVIAGAEAANGGPLVDDVALFLLTVDR